MIESQVIYTEFLIRIFVFLHVELLFNSFVALVLLIFQGKYDLVDKTHKLLQMYVEQDEETTEENIGSH